MTPMAEPAVWVYKNNAKGHGYQTATGDWDSFFAEPGDGTWGGEATMGNASRARMREMRPGDLVLAWQSDRRRAMGVLRFDGLVQSADGERMSFTPMARFATPVPLLELRAHVHGLENVAAFPAWVPADAVPHVTEGGASAARRVRLQPSEGETTRRRGQRPSGRGAGRCRRGLR